jgi:hypothetical protein
MLQNRAQAIDKSVLIDQFDLKRPASAASALSRA